MADHALATRLDRYRLRVHAPGNCLKALPLLRLLGIWGILSLVGGVNESHKGWILHRFRAPQWALVSLLTVNYGF
jgi:hypothetical protein